MPNGVLVPKVTWIVNTEPNHQKSRDLISVPVGHGDMMQVHPDLVEDNKWTIVTFKRKQKLKKDLNCYVISLVADDYDTSTILLTN